MPHFSNKKLIILLVGMILLVALISFSLRDRQNATLPEQFIKDSVGLAQSVVAKPANYITGIFYNIQSLLNTYEENQRLKMRLEDFAVLQAEVNTLKSENEQLRELLEKKIAYEITIRFVQQSLQEILISGKKKLLSIKALPMV